MNNIVNVGKQCSSKVRRIETIIKYFYATKSAADLLDKYQSRFARCDNYYGFQSQKRMIEALNGKPNTLKRKEKIKMMEKEKTVIKSRNNLLKTIELKELKYQEEQYHDFLDDQTTRLKQGQELTC